MQVLLFLLPVALAVGIPHQEPHNTHHLPSDPHLQRRDRIDPFDLDAVINARPYDVYEMVNPTPAQIDQRARAREDFLDDSTREYGSKPSKIVNGGRRPMKDLSKKQIAAARENKRCHEDNDRMSVKFDDEEDFDDVVAPGKKPVLELGFGYNKGSKYDNGYGHLRAFDKSILDAGAVGALAAGMAKDPDIDYYNYVGADQ